MNNARFIPQHKHDIKAVENLKIAQWEDVKVHAMEVLSWIADINWPVADPLAELLAFHTNDLKEEMLEIFRGNDGEWKSMCIRRLVYLSKEDFIDPDIIKELKILVAHPTKSDIESDIPEEALLCIEKWDKENSDL